MYKYLSAIENICKDYAKLVVCIHVVCAEVSVRPFVTAYGIFYEDFSSVAFWVSYFISGTKYMLRGLAVLCFAVFTGSVETKDSPVERFGRGFMSTVENDWLVRFLTDINLVSEVFICLVLSCFPDALRPFFLLISLLTNSFHFIRKRKRPEQQIIAE